MTTGSMFAGQFSPIPASFQSIAVTNGAAVGFNMPIPSGPKGYPKYVLVQVLGANVNWRDDGTVPANNAGGGMFINAGDDPVGFAGNIFTAQFISISGNGSIIMASFYY